MGWFNSPILEYEMDEPPVKVKCRKCGELCGATVVKTKAFGKEYRKWEFSCHNFKCELGFGEVQHRAKA